MQSDGGISTESAACLFCLEKCLLAMGTFPEKGFLLGQQKEKEKKRTNLMIVAGPRKYKDD